MEALKTAAKQILGNQKTAMRDIVSGLDGAALNWKPLDGQETNSIAVLITHALDAERYLIAASVDVTFDRDREAQFRVEVESAADLLALIDRVEAEVNGWLDSLTSAQLAAEVARPNRTHAGAWWLLHAIEHSNEHVGQALLTRQLYEGQRH
jgi:uncharacterized damage-inducible protein DinB